MCCITMHMEELKQFLIFKKLIVAIYPVYSSNFLVSLLILPGLIPMPELQGVQLLPAATS